MKRNNSTYKITLSALFAALCCTITMFVKIPLPAGGYVHLGDAFVLLSGWVLGPFYGGAAAGIGSMLADILSGYAQYAVFTFVIKALMAFTAYHFSNSFSKSPLIGKVTGGITAELIMSLGYFLCDWFFYGSSAIVNLFMYLLKGAVNLIAGIVFANLILPHFKSNKLK